MNGKKSPGVALWKAIKDSEVQDDIDEVLAMSDDQLDAFLTAHGGDPAKIRASGEALAKELDARRDRLAWHGDMEARLARARAKAAAMRAAPREKLSGEELRKRIELARNDPRFAAPVAALFRKKTPEACTDEELETLLEQIELLATLEDE
jgi:hypothetical protein